MSAQCPISSMVVCPFARAGSDMVVMQFPGFPLPIPVPKGVGFSGGCDLAVRRDGNLTCSAESLDEQSRG